MLDTKAKWPHGLMTRPYEASSAGSANGASTVADWLNVSHELRTPTHAILGHVELLLSGVMGPLSSEVRTSLGDIQKAGLALFEQIDQAISIGEELPLETPSSPTPDALFDLLKQTWSRTEPPPGLGMTIPCPDGSGQSRTRPSRWLRLAAILLNDLGATPLDPVSMPHSSDLLSMCDDGHSHPPELRLECPLMDHIDVLALLKIIGEVVVMAGGTLDCESDQLILTWPSSERLL